MATIKDIAEFAGVSRGTVDRVIHGRPNVDPLVMQRVKKAIEILGYESKTKKVQIKKRAAILVPKWSDVYFNRQIAAGIHRAIRHIADPSFELVEVPLTTMTAQELLIEMQKQIAAGIDGLIVRAENIEEMRQAIEYALSQNIAVITYDADIQDSGRLCFVGQDLLKAGEIAAGVTSKLIKPSEHILIVVGNMRVGAHKARVDGFCKRLRELGFDTASYQIIESNEMYDLTSHLVAEAFRMNSKIRAVYMATEPVTGGLEGIRRSKVDASQVHVICNDLTFTTRKYLKEGKIDFVIGQAFQQKSYRAVISMYQFLTKGQKPAKDIHFTDTYLVSQEML